MSRTPSGRMQKRKKSKAKKQSAKISRGQITPALAARGHERAPLVQDELQSDLVASAPLPDGRAASQPKTRSAEGSPQKRGNGESHSHSSTVNEIDHVTVTPTEKNGPGDSGEVEPPPLNAKAYPRSRQRSHRHRHSLWRALLVDIRKEGMRTIANILVFGSLIVLALVVLQHFVGFDGAMKSVAAFIKGDWAAKEILGDLMQQEQNPRVFKVLASLDEGPRHITGTSIRIDSQFLPENDGALPRRFRSFEVVHEGPLQDTSLLSLRDELIVTYRSETSHDDSETNCGVMAEWFVPRMMDSSADQRGRFIVMVIAIRNINPMASPCPALLGDR